jgi:cytochrome c peroxidase
MQKPIVGILITLCLVVVASQCRKKEEAAPVGAKPFKVNIPLGLNEDLMHPKENPLTNEKIALGHMLYFDERLSLDGTVSCATCHHPDKGWGDGAPVSTGIKGQQGTRNAPTVINSTYMFSQFWDGRAANLEEQAKGPLINPIEMGNLDHDAVVKRIKEIKGYQPLFQKAFGEGPTIENIAQAIASFERTVLGGNSKFDRFQNGDTAAFTPEEKLGMDLFFGKANCTRCHVGATFSDSQFHNLGVGFKQAKPDLGRHDHTKKEEDQGAFKTPGLRDITKTAPYMHDGSQTTLEEVIDFYDKGGEKNLYLDINMKPLNLSAEEKKALVAFMKALDSEPYPRAEKPGLPQ